MIETRRLKNVVIFIQIILRFVLSRIIGFYIWGRLFEWLIYGRSINGILRYLNLVRKLMMKKAIQNHKLNIVWTNIDSWKIWESQNWNSLKQFSTDN